MHVEALRGGGGWGSLLVAVVLRRPAAGGSGLRFGRGLRKDGDA